MSLHELLHPIRARRARRAALVPPKPYGWRDLTSWPPELKP
jgi:hypothetical protein